MTGARVIRVLPDVAALERAFDYVVPEQLAADVRVGTMVRVPLHGRRVGGWVVADNVTPPARIRLQQVAKVTGWGPPASLVDLARWAGWWWAGPVRAVLRAASPPGAVRALPAAAPAGRGGGGPGGPPEPLVAEAFERRRAVVRLPPLASVLPFVLGAAGRGAALIVSPSVAGAGQLAGALGRAGFPVAQLPGQWAKAAAGGSVVVGARGAAWSPQPVIAAVVVVDAHDEALREERSPAWSAWEVAAERAGREGVPCVVLSPCPTVEQLAWGDVLTAPRAEERAGWPVVEVVDQRSSDPRTGLYSDRLVALLRTDRRVVCVLNRKGRARLLVCGACGEVVRCERCAAGMVQPEKGSGLRCPSCGVERAAVCQACGSTALKALRLGVTRVREELEALAGRPVAEAGAEGETAGDHAGVVVGTEAVLHAGGRAHAVVFLDFDQELMAPRFRAGEQALALLARAARLVGGRDGGGRVVVQTRSPEHDVLRAAVAADPARFSDTEAARRAALRLPPAFALARVTGEGAAEYVGALPAVVEVLGPAEGAWLLRTGTRDELAAALREVPRAGAKVRVEVDPLRA